MTQSDADASLKELLLGRLADLSTQVGRVQDQLSSQAATLVARGEWHQRNENVDSRFIAQGREIGDLRTEIRSGRHPWPVWVAGGASIVGILAGFDVI